ncbi:MAG: hypothetical protein ACTSPB_03690 [Candidatus Thorarchaeota archaeon]
MSDNKKTQKQLIEELTKAVERLTSRVEALERKNSPFHWEPSPRERPFRRIKTKCPHCNGSGEIDDYSPQHPYYDGNFYNGTA